MLGSSDVAGGTAGKDWGGKFGGQYLPVWEINELCPEMHLHIIYIYMCVCVCVFYELG